MRLLIPAVFAALAWSADYSGKYEGALESAGGGRQNVVATLRQQDNRVTGTIGPNASQQTPLLNGKIENGRMTVEIDPLGGLRISFPEAGAPLTGTVVRRNGSASLFDRIVLRRTGDLTLADTLSPLENEGPFRSLRIVKLRDELSRNPDAATRFWDDVKASGTPLVEADPLNDRFQFVTFLWRGKPEHKNVLVLWHPFSTARPADYFMVRIPDTDVWFRTLRMPRGSRLKYSLSPNDPLAEMPPATGRRNEIADPLNSNGMNLELPGAPPQPYYQQREGVAKLTVATHKISSQRLKQEREVSVYTPPGYDPKASPYRSLYLFDGEDKDGNVFASWTFENLIAEKKITPLVIVRIRNPNPGSRQQLAANPAFFDFISQELVPFIRGQYNVSKEARETAIGGYSLGGFAATYAGLRHSDLFGLVLSQSGSFWFDPARDDQAEPNWLAQQFVASPRLPLRFYLDAGQFEIDLSGRGFGILIPNRHMRDVLRAKGYDVTYREFPGGHDSMNWRGTLADGVMALFGPPR